MFQRTRLDPGNASEIVSNDPEEKKVFRLGERPKRRVHVRMAPVKIPDTTPFHAPVSPLSSFSGARRNLRVEENPGIPGAKRTNPLDSDGPETDIGRPASSPDSRGGDIPALRIGMKAEDQSRKPSESSGIHRFQLPSFSEFLDSPLPSAPIVTWLSSKIAACPVSTDPIAALSYLAVGFAARFRCKEWHYGIHQISALRSR